MNIFKVTEEEIELLATQHAIRKDFDEVVSICNWETEVIVMAKREEEAQQLAEKYLKGELKPDRLIWRGRELKVLFQWKES